MKGNKKLKHISSILTFIILFQYASIIIPFLEVNAAQSATDSTGVTWSYDLDSNGNAINVKWKSGDNVIDDHTVEIPSTLDNHNVISIGPDVVGVGARWPGTGGVRVIIPNSVKTIEKNAFSNNGFYSQINIPSSVETIGYEAFYASGLTNIQIPSSVTSIGYNAFWRLY